MTSDDAASRRSSPAERAHRVRYRRAWALMLMTLLVPGSAQLVAGNRRVGRLAMGGWLALLTIGGFCLVLGMLWKGFAFWVAWNVFVLGVLRVVLMGIAIAWAVLFIDSWRLGMPQTLRKRHRLSLVAANGVLCFSVAGALLFAAHIIGVQRDFTATMFGDGAASKAVDGRYNVLLLGGDAGAGRSGSRPDSINVASIDVRTGKTLLISLPRNMENFPFAEGSIMDREFPDGFDVDYLNAVSTWAADNSELFGSSPNPEIDATLSAVEGITGLKMNYWVMVDLEGFKDLVDAFGGVTLNVRDEIPVGLPSDSFFRYIEPGVKKLDGTETLWFARARYGSDDYSRMARQKCVLAAMLDQVSPQTALRNFADIADAGSSMVSTSIPRSDAARFSQLALMAKERKLATLSLVPPLIDTADPDVDLIQDKIAAALDSSSGATSQASTPAEADGAQKSAQKSTQQSTQKAPKSSAPKREMTGGSFGSLGEGYDANESDDLGASC